VLLDVDSDAADAHGDEPVWLGDRVVGRVTSGSYGHHVQGSLALAYVETALAEAGTSLEVSVMGHRRLATVLPGAAYDPDNTRLRA